MDPQANLMEQLKISQDIQQFNDGALERDDIIMHAERLAELVIALHVWIRDGGFLPQDWSQEK